MHFEFDYIVEYLSERFGVLMAYGDSDTEYGLPTVFKNKQTVESRRIYLVEYGQEFTSLQKEDVLVVICGCPAARQPTPDNVKCALVILDVSTEAVFPVYSSLVDMFHQHMTWQESLQSLLDGGASIQSILDASLGMFGNPLLYFSNELDEFVLAVPQGMEDLAPRSPFEKTGYRMPAEVASPLYLKQGINETKPFIISALDYHTMEYIPTLWASTRDTDGECIGLVMMLLLRGEAVTKGHYHYIACLRDNLEKYLNSCKSTDEYTFEGIRPVLERILDNSYSDKGALKRRLHSLGWDFSGTYVCLDVLMEAEIDLASMSAYYCRHLEREIEGSCALYHKDRIVLVVNIDNKNMSPREIINKILNVTQSSKVRVGISNSFADIMLLDGYWHQAQAALNIGLMTKPKESEYLFSDYAVRYILRWGTSELSRDMVCAPGVFSLLKQVNTSEVDYVGTLCAYLRNSCNASLTARDLFIHRTTLKYRLEHIESITRMDLNDPYNRLYAIMSLSLFDYY